MKTVKVLLSKTFKFRFSLLLINVLMGACSELPEAPLFSAVSGPEDVIPFDAVGSGKLGFHRGFTYFVIDADTKSSWGLSGITYGAAISPDGKYIACQRPYAFNKPYTILVYDIAGGNILADSETTPGSGNPGWTADSKSVLYVSYGASGDGQMVQIARHSLEEKAGSTIATHKPYSSISSSISASIHEEFIYSIATYGPTGKVIEGLFTTNGAGAEPTQLRLSDSTGTAKAPAWSPDGEYIAYVKTTSDGTPGYTKVDIIVSDKHGANPKTIAAFDHPPSTYSGVLGLEPSLAWSPDGSRIAFIMFEADGVHVFVINSDGTGLTKVTSQGGSVDSHLSWSR